MPLEHVNIRWDWLKDHLDRIIDEINQNKPLPSSSVAIDVNTGGSMLRVIGAPGGAAASAPTDDPWRTTPDGQTAGWNTAAIKISDGAGGCVDAWIWYWGTPAATTPRPI